MASIHPSETPPLGWLVPCLAVRDLGASLDFYGKLDLVRYGGDPAQGWAMLRNRSIEIHLFQGHIPKDGLNFRGSDPAAIRAMLADRGLGIANDMGERSFILHDPDGRDVFFDSTADETRAYFAGNPLTLPPAGEPGQGEGLDLGNLTWSLACRSAEATASFYETLGFVREQGDSPQARIHLFRRDHPPAPGRRLGTTTLALFERIPADTLTFHGGDVSAISTVLIERDVDPTQGMAHRHHGAESLLLLDPDRRSVLFEADPTPSRNG